MNNIVKYGAIAVGGYLLYNYLTNGSMNFPNILPTGNNGQTSSVSGSSPNPVNNTAATASLRDRMQAALNAAGLGSQALTIDQYNYFYNQLTGKTVPAPEDWGFSGETRLTKIWLDNYLAIAAREGLTGLAGNFALGGVVPTANVGFYPQMGSGIERASKRILG